MEYLTVDEAAEFLRVSVSYLRKLTSARRIPFRKLGKRCVYARSELRAWADARRVKPVREQIAERAGA